MIQMVETNCSEIVEGKEINTYHRDVALAAVLRSTHTLPSSYVHVRLRLKLSLCGASSDTSVFMEHMRLITFYA